MLYYSKTQLLKTNHLILFLVCELARVTLLYTAVLQDS